MIYYYESKKGVGIGGLNDFINYSELYKEDHVYFIYTDTTGKWCLGIAYEKNKGPIICIKIKFRNKSRIYILYRVSGNIDNTRRVEVDMREETNIVNLICINDGFYSMSVRPGEDKYLLNRCKYDDNIRD